MNISRALKFLAVPVLVSIYVGCSPVNFAKDDEANKCQNFGRMCVTSNGRDYFDDKVTIAGGLVDILIVNDNSASMSFEQTQLATRLSGFIQKLEAQSADYRIAITTTDISSSSNPPRAINQNGALQDGRLIKFANGAYYLTSASGSLAQKDAWFKQAIQRPETASCEAFIKNNYGQSSYSTNYDANCPSGDERGIYAANLTIKNNPNSFIRPNAHLAIIVLADEDERSQLYWYNQQNPGSYPGFDLADMDRPQTLLSNARATFGGGKILSVHSIITTTASCKAIQDNQLLVNGVPVVSGSYGTLYSQASQLTGGVIGDICAETKDYTTQLGEISTNILNRINSLALACASPKDLVVTVTGQSGVGYTASGKEVKFNKQLAPGTSVRLQYSCETL